MSKLYKTNSYTTATKLALSETNFSNKTIMIIVLQSHELYYNIRASISNARYKMSLFTKNLRLPTDLLSRTRSMSVWWRLTYFILIIFSFH